MGGQPGFPGPLNMPETWRHSPGPYLIDAVAGRGGGGERNQRRRGGVQKQADCRGDKWTGRKGSHRNKQQPEVSALISAVITGVDTPAQTAPTRTHTHTSDAHAAGMDGRTWGGWHCCLRRGGQSLTFGALSQIITPQATMTPSVCVCVCVPSTLHLNCSRSSPVAWRRGCTAWMPRQQMHGGMSGGEANSQEIVITTVIRLFCGSAERGCNSWWGGGVGLIFNLLRAAPRFQRS